MTITVHSAHKWVSISRDGAEDLRHEVPRKNKFFKEELRLLREEMTAWLRGEICDCLVLYKPRELSFYRRAIYHAIVRVVQETAGVVLITTYVEEQSVIR